MWNTSLFVTVIFPLPGLKIESILAAIIQMVLTSGVHCIHALWEMHCLLPILKEMPPADN